MRARCRQASFDQSAGAFITSSRLRASLMRSFNSVLTWVSVVDCKRVRRRMIKPRNHAFSCSKSIEDICQQLDLLMAKVALSRYGDHKEKNRCAWIVAPRAA